MITGSVLARCCCSTGELLGWKSIRLSPGGMLVLISWNCPQSLLVMCLQLQSNYLLGIWSESKRPGEGKNYLVIGPYRSLINAVSITSQWNQWVNQCKRDQGSRTISSVNKQYTRVQEFSIIFWHEYEMCIPGIPQVKPGLHTYYMVYMALARHHIASMLLKGLQWASSI